MATVDIEPRGQFSQEMVKAMNEKEITIRELAEKTEATYEHIRRLVHGIALPSSLMLKEVCKVLGMDYENARKLATSDRIVQKYGSVVSVIAGKNPELAEVERVWPDLHEGQKQDLIAFVKSMAHRNRQAK